MSKYQFLDSYTLKNGAEVKNRIVMAPMTEMSSFENGIVTNDEIEYYRRRSGGVGMEITGCANVSEIGKGFEGELSVANDSVLPQLSKLAQSMKSNGTKAILQIFNAGRMTTSEILRGKKPVSASAIRAERPGSEEPASMSEEEILETISDFGNATRRAILSGFDGVEIHGANTYLIQQFFSPNSNQRDDKWGGDLKSRMNFPLEVIKKVMNVVKESGKSKFIVGYRISPEEIETPGIQLSETLEFVSKLSTSGIDYLHVSMGDVWRTSLNDKSDTEPINKQIKQALGDEIPLMVVGNVETPVDAEKAANSFEFVAMGRELIREPNWVEKVIAGDETSIKYKLSPTDLEDLAIPAPLWGFLTTVFRPIAGLSTEKDPATSFKEAAAPWEKF
ncbi:NADH-dependent flavin oxidoreductase [Pediococcus claussenii]|nr:NADH-dependent flavin oxidoreductase [Pediococcus claussenii]ANZ69196.1 NADH-dependent flavin oxidoreductase [Pediococcus claussenii]ANZ71013.1 NADH-dependent flavin oxidoreductase [Pediococcus claussenii]